MQHDGGLPGGFRRSSPPETFPRTVFMCQASYCSVRIGPHRDCCFCAGEAYAAHAIVRRSGARPAIGRWRHCRGLSLMITARVHGDGSCCIPAALLGQDTNGGGPTPECTEQYSTLLCFGRSVGWIRITLGIDPSSHGKYLMGPGCCVSPPTPPGTSSSRSLRRSCPPTRTRPSCYSTLAPSSLSPLQDDLVSHKLLVTVQLQYILSSLPLPPARLRLHSSWSGRDEQRTFDPSSGTASSGADRADSHHIGPRHLCWRGGEGTWL
nr:hypothetical protein CFP56_76247 [Quercus suber]